MKSFERFLALSDLLEELLRRPVELVTSEALSPFLGPHILAEAKDVLRARLIRKSTGVRSPACATASFTATSGWTTTWSGTW
jgi:hypothetical protein